MSGRSSSRIRRPKDVLTNQTYDKDRDKPNTSDWYHVLGDTPKQGPTNVLTNTSKIPDVTPGRKRDSKWYTHLEDTGRMSYKSRENSKDVSSSLSNVSSLSENESSVRAAPVKTRYPLRKRKGLKSIDPIEYQSALSEKSLKLRSNKSRLSELPLIEKGDSTDGSNSLITIKTKKRPFTKKQKNIVSKLADDFQSVFDSTGNPVPPVPTQQLDHNVSSDENSLILSESLKSNKKSLFQKKKQQRQSVKVISTKFQEALDGSDKNKKRKVDSLQEQDPIASSTFIPSLSMNKQHDNSNISSDQSFSALEQFGKEEKPRLFKRSRQEQSRNTATYQQALESDIPVHHEISSTSQSVVKTSDSSHKSTPDGHSFVGKKKLFKKNRHLPPSVSAERPSTFQEALGTESDSSRVSYVKTRSSKFSNRLVVKLDKLPILLNSPEDFQKNSIDSQNSDSKSIGEVSKKSSVEYSKPGPLSKKPKGSLGANPSRFLEVTDGNEGSVANSDNKVTMQTNDDSREHSSIAVRKRPLREKKQGNIAVFANDFQAALDVDDSSARIDSSKLEPGPKSITNRFSTSPNVGLSEGYKKKSILRNKTTTSIVVNPNDFQNALDENVSGEINPYSENMKRHKSVADIKAISDVQNSKTSPLSKSSQQNKLVNISDLPRDDIDNVSSISVTSSNSSTILPRLKKKQRHIPVNLPETGLSLDVAVNGSMNSTSTKPAALSKTFQKLKSVSSDLQTALDVDENMSNVTSRKSLVQPAISSNLMLSKSGPLSKKEQVPVGLPSQSNIHDSLHVDGENVMDNSNSVHESLEKSASSLNSPYTKPGPLSKKLQKRKPINSPDFQPSSNDGGNKAGNRLSVQTAFEKSALVPYDNLLEKQNTPDHSLGSSVQKKDENPINLSNESLETKVAKRLLSVVDDDTLIFNPQANSTRYYSNTPKSEKPRSKVTQGTHDRMSQVGLEEFNPSMVSRRLSRRTIAGVSGTNQESPLKTTESDIGAISQSQGKRLSGNNKEIIEKSEHFANRSSIGLITTPLREEKATEMSSSKNRVSANRPNPNPKEIDSEFETNSSISSFILSSQVEDRTSKVKKLETTGFNRSIEALKIMTKRSSGAPIIPIPLDTFDTDSEKHVNSFGVVNVDKEHRQAELIHEPELNKNKELPSRKIDPNYSLKEVTKSISVVLNKSKSEQSTGIADQVLSTSRNSQVSARDGSVSLFHNNTSDVNVRLVANKEGTVSYMDSVLEHRSTGRDQYEELQRFPGSNSSVFESLDENEADSPEGSDVQMFYNEVENDAETISYKIPSIPVVTSEKNQTTSMKIKLSDVQEDDANYEQRTHGDVLPYSNTEMEGEIVPELVESVTSNGLKPADNMSDRGQSTNTKISRRSIEIQSEQEKIAKKLNPYGWALGTTSVTAVKEPKFQSVSEFLAEAKLRNKNREIEYQKEDELFKKMVRPFKAIHPAQSQITKFFNPAPRPVVGKLTKPKPPPKPVDPDFLVNGKFYRPPKLARPSLWCTDRLYNVVMKKTKERYGELKMRRKAEEFVRAFNHSVSLAIRCKKNFEPHVNEAKILLYKMGIIKTTMDFYTFIQDFMPRDFRRQAIPTQRAYGVMTGPKYDPHLDIFAEIRL